MEHNLLDQRHYGLLVREGKFKIKLSELWLPEGVQFFIPVAIRKLVISVHRATHQQLFVDLGTLWQTETFAVGVGRHQKFFGAPRSVMPQCWCLNVYESALVLKVTAHFADDFGS